MAPTTAAAMDSDTPVTVRLLSFPRNLFGAAEWHWRALLREYLLRGMSAHDQPYDLDEIGRAGVALDRVSLAADAAADRDEPADHYDVTVGLPSAAADFATLQGVMDDALRLANLEELLQLTPLPEVVALRMWICDEAMKQAVGGEPTPWQLPTEMRPAQGGQVEWDRSLTPPQSVAWLVGDDQNRIVAASTAALELLGWPEDDLVGQRLLVVIPPALRERHVAGFTRSVLDGDPGVLGQPLYLPAMTRSGAEVAIALTLSRHPARRGRTVYLATLETRDTL